MRKGHTTSSVKPKMGDYGGGWGSTPSSDKQGGYGAPSGTRESTPWGRNPKQKSSKADSKQAPYRNTVKPGDPGNKGPADETHRSGGTRGY